MYNSLITYTTIGRFLGADAGRLGVATVPPPGSLDQRERDPELPPVPWRPPASGHTLGSRTPALWARGLPLSELQDSRSPGSRTPGLQAPGSGARSPSIRHLAIQQGQAAKPSWSQTQVGQAVKPSQNQPPSRPG